MKKKEFAINFLEEKAKNMISSSEDIEDAIDYIQKEIDFLERKVYLEEEYEIYLDDLEKSLKEKNVDINEFNILEKNIDINEFNALEEKVKIKEKLK